MNSRGSAKLFRPRIVQELANYSQARFMADVIAGVTVGIIALPLAIAFGIASGVKPEQGIFTAIVAGFIISALGGARLQIGGPTGAFVVIVYGIIQQYGLANLMICTMMAGVILIIMGLCRMGQMIKFIPFPVTTGFTSGIAVVILLSQVKDFLGLSTAPLPADFFPKMETLYHALPTLNPTACIIGILSFFTLMLWPRYVSKRIPASIIVLLLGTGIVTFFQLPVETIQSRFGGVPQSLPMPGWPEIEFSQLRNLISPAVTIALLAGIESLLSAVVADGMTQDRHDSNTELIAQGVANFFCPLFGGIPATGAIARTVANIENGASSPLSGIIHSVTLLGIILVAAPLAKYIPMVCLSAVLLRVAVNMGEWDEFRRLRRIPRSDAAVFLATFAMTVLFDLTLAVEVGMVLAAVLFIRRISDTTQIAQVTAENEVEGAQHSVVGKEIPPGVMIYEIQGTFLFGAAEKMERVLQNMQQLPAILILRMHRVPAMDATGLHALEILVSRMQEQNNHVILSGPHTQPYAMMIQAGFIEQVGEDNVAPDLEAALLRARELLSSSVQDSNEKR